MNKRKLDMITPEDIIFIKFKGCQAQFIHNYLLKLIKTTHEIFIEFKKNSINFWSFDVIQSSQQNLNLTNSNSFFLNWIVNEEYMLSMKTDDLSDIFKQNMIIRYMEN